MKSKKGCFLENTHAFTNKNLEKKALHNFDCVLTLIPKSTPCIIRKCARCNSDRFASSDKFRVNANKKVIDVWLVFKCVSCDYTLNVSIISRKSVGTIDRTLLERFYSNDLELAWKYAFDPSFMEKDAMVDWKIEFDVEPENSDLQNILLSERNNISEVAQPKTINILIESHFFLKMPIYLVLRQILNVSRSYLEKIQTNDHLEIRTLEEKPMTLMHSIGFGCRVAICTRN